MKMHIFMEQQKFSRYPGNSVNKAAVLLSFSEHLNISNRLYSPQCSSQHQILKYYNRLLKDLDYLFLNICLHLNFFTSGHK